MVGQRGVSPRPSRQQGTARRIQRPPERTERPFVLISTAVIILDPFGGVSPTSRARSSEGTVDRDLPTALIGDRDSPAYFQKSFNALAPTHLERARSVPPDDEYSDLLIVERSG